MTNRLHHSLALLLAICALGAGRAGAQAVDATMSLARPGIGVAHTFNMLQDVDRPAVVLVRPSSWSGQDAISASAGRDAVYSWEVFLLGLQIPFQTIDASQLGRSVPKGTKLLVVPAADALGDRQRRTLLRWVDQGGGLIASGRFGAIDERGRAVADRFFTDMLGAEAITRLPDQPFGLLHGVDARTPVAGGIDPGFRLNISAQRPLLAARPITGLSVGQPASYSGSDDARLAEGTLMILNERGKGRVFWTRFNPQDVSRERDQQLVYQRLAVNAIAYVTRTPGVSIEAWPNGSRSVLSIAALPSVGFDALGFLGGWNDFSDLLRETSTRATFFLSSREAVGFPQFVTDLTSIGEVATAGPGDDVISGLPHDVQAQRLAAARNEIGASGGLGVYPPGGFYDGNTVRAVLEEGFGYLLLPAGWSLAPGLTRWWDDVDYRAVRASTESSDLPFLTARAAQPVQAANDPTAEPVIGMPLDPGVLEYPARFAEVNAAGGLFVLPFYPEMTRNGSGRFRELRETISLAQNADTWTATLGEVAQWWSDRSHVWLQSMTSDRDGLDIEIVNDLDEAVEGITLLLSTGTADFDTYDLDGLEVEMAPADIAGSRRVIIQRLPPGSTRLRFNFD